MCVLVTVMCLGLVLLEAGAAAGPSGQLLLQSCVAQEKSCRIHFKMENRIDSRRIDSNVVLPEAGTTSSVGSATVLCSRGECQLPQSALNLLLSTCPPCRRKRRPRSLMLREAALIARSVGLDLGAPEAAGGESSPGYRDNSVAEVKVVQPQWKVRLLSMSGEKDDVVSTQVGWDNRVPASWYLVTWELEGGGLRGNLLTENTSALLTLGPSAVYHLQVSSTSSGDTSECLVVDTHPPSSSQPLDTFTRQEVKAGVSAAILLFLALLLLSTRGWRSNQSPSSKDVDQLREYNHFKVYPPPITLSLDVSPDSYQPHPQL